MSVNRHINVRTRVQTPFLDTFRYVWTNQANPQVKGLDIPPDTSDTHLWTNPPLIDRGDVQ